MPMQLIWEDEGVIRRFSGRVTVEDIRQSLQQVHADRRFAKLRYSINDFLGAEPDIAVSKAALADAALRTILASTTNPAVLVAIVATQAQVLALAEFYTSPSYMPYKARVFQTVEQARDWIAQH